MVSYHLVVLVHGIWGNSSHMAYLASQIEQKCKPKDPDVQLVVYRTGSHLGYLTYDGVDVNGKRISDEILLEVHRLSATGPVSHFSLIGYSMGGLVARYALGVLYHHGFFDSVRPVHFVTFVTPHVGSLNPSRSLSLRLFNYFAPLVLAHTGQHMFLKDKRVQGSKEYLPLLQWMASPSSKFYKALALFEHRSLYANTINDRRTSWYTTSISNVDPFNSMVNESLSAYQLEYVEGYDPTVIDFAKPIGFQTINLPKNRRFSLRRFLFKTFVWMKVLAGLVVMAPAYALYSLGNAIWQRIKLAKRLSVFTKESAHSLQALYDHPDSEEKSHSAFEERVMDQTDMFMDSIFSAVNSASYYNYHESITRKRRPSEEANLLEKSVVNLKGQTVLSFSLRLTPNQEAIVQLLNTLKWAKFPVIIRNTKATHAAVIYRHPDPQLEEGKLVVEHFIEKVFAI